MGDGINVNIFSGKAHEIAIDVDNNNDHNSKLSGREISIFLEKCQENGIDIETSYPELCLGNIQKDIAERDATCVKPPLVVQAQKIGESPEQSPQKSEENTPAKLGIDSDIRTNYNWSVEEFSKVLDVMLNNPRYNGKFDKSVFQGKAAAFIEAGKKFNIDPRILVAIAMHESARGTSRMAQELNNIGGLRINGKYHHFENVEASIDSIAKTMYTRCSEGYTTPKEIAYSGKYCAKGAAPKWLSDVKGYLNYFKNYGQTQVKPRSNPGQTQVKQ